LSPEVTIVLYSIVWQIILRTNLTAPVISDLGFRNKTTSSEFRNLESEGYLQIKFRILKVPYLFLMVLTIMLLDLKSLSNTSQHLKEDFRKGKDGFCLGLNRRHQWSSLTTNIRSRPSPCLVMFCFFHKVVLSDQYPQPLFHEENFKH
jgi:hypothetical protein